MVFVSLDRKSTRLNSSHGSISYAVFCLKKKNTRATPRRTPPHRRHSPPIPMHPHLACLAMTGGGTAAPGSSPRSRPCCFFFFFNDPATTEISPFSLQCPLPI